MTSTDLVARLSQITIDLDVPHAARYVTIGAGVLLAICLLTQKLRNRRLGKPLPGPWMPLRASSKSSIKQVNELRQNYGPVFGFRKLSMNFLFLCDVQSIREALVEQADVFSGRIHTPFLKYLIKDCGVISIDGPKWQEHRRFILSVLRNFGFGKNITERSIQDELSLLVSELANTGGKPTSPRLPIISSVANVICILVFGERCGNDPDFELLVRATSESIQNSQTGNVLVNLFYRFVLLMPGDKFGLKKLISTQAILQGFINRQIKQHLTSIDWNNQRDLIDAYLIEKRERDEKSALPKTFTDFQLFRVILELFIAGMETTSTTLTWALFLMAKHPDVQKRVQAEIDACIGDKPPAVADRAKLVYTTAVIHEVERYVTLVPFSVPHRVTEDTVLRGYFVPAGTFVTPFLYGAHHDEHVWKNPSRFDPSHFYDESTKSLINLHNLIPFSVGKRSCLGESLASQELLVFFAGVLQKFTIAAAAGQSFQEPDLSDVNIPIHMAPEYKVCLQERSN